MSFDHKKFRAALAKEADREIRECHERMKEHHECGDTASFEASATLITSVHYMTSVFLRALDEATGESDE